MAAHDLGEGAAKATLGFAIDSMLSEDLEDVRKIFEKIEQAFNNKNLTLLGQYISDDFFQNSLKKEQFLDLVSKIFKKYSKVHLTIQEVETSIDKNIKAEGKEVAARKIFIKFVSYWNFKGDIAGDNSKINLSEKEEFVLEKKGEEWHIVSAPDISLLLSL
jgi:hypothetical protein